jgi:hypothetical protein
MQRKIQEEMSKATVSAVAVGVPPTVSDGAWLPQSLDRDAMAVDCRDVLEMRRQSAAATALWISAARPCKRRVQAWLVRRIQSGVALRFPPHSKRGAIPKRTLRKRQTETKQMKTLNPCVSRALARSRSFP